MIDLRVDPGAPAADAIAAAARIILAGGLAVFPTDTVYGLAADLWNRPALRQVYVAKERPGAKGLIALIAEADQLELLASRISDAGRRLMERFWPGALTLVFPARRDVPSQATVDNTVGVRLPAHAVPRALIRASTILASTSANLSGQLSPRDADDVRRGLGERVDVLLDAGPVPGGIESTVVDVSGEEPRVIREGAIPAQEIWQALSG